MVGNEWSVLLFILLCTAKTSEANSLILAGKGFKGPPPALKCKHPWEEQ